MACSIGGKSLWETALPGYLSPRTDYFFFAVTLSHRLLAHPHCRRSLLIRAAAFSFAVSIPPYCHLEVHHAGQGECDDARQGGWGRSDRWPRRHERAGTVAGAGPRRREVTGATTGSGATTGGGGRGGARTWKQVKARPRGCAGAKAGPREARCRVRVAN
jgi:hypothetical protein